MYSYFGDTTLAEISSIRSMGSRATADDLVGQFNARGEMFHAITQFSRRVHLHEFALAAPAIVRRHPHHVEHGRAEKLFVRAFLCIRWMMPDSVTTTKRRAGLVRQ